MSVEADSGSGATGDGSFSGLFRAASVAAFATVGITVLQILLGVLWPPPDFAPTAEVARQMLSMAQSEPARALVTLDGLMLIDYLLLIVVYLALWAALHRAAPSLSLSGTALALVAITLYFAVNPSLTIFALAARYGADGTAAAAAPGVVTAAQSALAVFEGTGFLVHYVVMGVAGILVSVGMLRSGVFTRVTAVAGILQGAMMLVPVTFGTVGLVMAVGSLVPFIVWFILVGRRLWQLGES